MFDFFKIKLIVHFTTFGTIIIRQIYSEICRLLKNHSKEFHFFGRPSSAKNRIAPVISKFRFLAKSNKFRTVMAIPRNGCT